MKTNDENIIHLWLKVCWNIFAIINNLKHYFDDKFQRSKNVNILEKTESSGIGGKLKEEGARLIQKFDKQKKGYD